jgi:hypothetical protein
MSQNATNVFNERFRAERVYNDMIAHLERWPSAGPTSVDQITR